MGSANAIAGDDSTRRNNSADTGCANSTSVIPLTSSSSESNKGSTRWAPASRRSQSNGSETAATLACNAAECTRTTTCPGMNSSRASRGA